MAYNLLPTILSLSGSPMTIAACYLSSEAVVFGADSAATFVFPAPAGQLPRYGHYNFAQKIFELGGPSTLAVVIWGLGSLPTLSYRTLMAQFADHLRSSAPLPDMPAVALAYSDYFWNAYTAAIPAEMARAQQLHGQAARTLDEEREYAAILNVYSGGFCLGGNLDHARRPAAFEFQYSPLLAGPPIPAPLQIGELKLWRAEHHGADSVRHRPRAGRSDLGVTPLAGLAGRFTGTDTVPFPASADTLAAPGRD